MFMFIGFFLARFMPSFPSFSRESRRSEKVWEYTWKSQKSFYQTSATSLQLETHLASRWEGVKLPRASGKSPDFPGGSPNFPGSFLATSPKVLSLYQRALSGGLDPWGVGSANLGRPIIASNFPQIPLKQAFSRKLGATMGRPKFADPTFHGSTPPLKAL